MCSTRPDELPVSGEGVASICLNAIPSSGVFANDAPMSIPDFGSWVLYDDPVAELELRARELGPAFFDLFCVLKPLFHVSGKLRVRDSLILLFGGWSSCPLAPPKHPLCRAQLVANPRGVSVL